MSRAEIEQLLPSVFRRTALPGSPLMAALEAMEALHAPDEEILATIDHYLDPRRAPEPFVVYLASWVGLRWLVVRPGIRDRLLKDGTLRDLVANGARLARMRGTREGLGEFLHLVTGGAEFDIIDAVDEGGRARAFAITVVAPPELEADRALLEMVCAHEKPVYAQCEVRFGIDRPPEPTATRSSEDHEPPVVPPDGPTPPPPPPASRSTQP